MLYNYINSSQLRTTSFWTQKRKGKGNYVLLNNLNLSFVILFLNKVGTCEHLEDQTLNFKPKNLTYLYIIEGQSLTPA